MSVVRGSSGTAGRMFGALRHRDYRWWFASQMLAASGTMTQAIALSWLVLQMTGSAVWLAVLTICAWAPMLPLGPWAGALVDRADRRRLLMLTTSLLLALSCVLTVLTAIGAVAALAASTAWPTGRQVRLLASSTGVVVILVASAPVAALAFAGMAVAGFTSIWFIAAANTLVQLSSASSLRGRVMGVWTMALPGTVPLTGLITAWTDQVLGPPLGFAAAGVALLSTVAIGWSALGRHRPGEIISDTIG